MLVIYSTAMLALDSPDSYATARTCSSEARRRKLLTLSACILLAAVFASLLQTASLLPQFQDITRSAGISYKTVSSSTSQKYLPESMVGGVAVFDYDNDGWLDIYFVNGAAISDPMSPGQVPDKSSPEYWNRLYRNNHNGTFTDVTERAGVRSSFYGMGVAAADYDNDGYTDLYVTNLQSNVLYRNNGNGTFTDVTEKAGVAAAGWSTGAAFADIDRDGYLDLVVARYVTWSFDNNPWCGEKKPGYRSYCHPDQFPPAQHLVYRNNGNGTFTDVSKQSGIAAHPGKGLGVAINDFDRDGWPDILIANDSVAQQLFRNKHDGTFEETALTSGLAYDDDGKPFAGMGLDASDYDRDGWPDVFVDALGNQRYALFRNMHSVFDYVSGPAGIAEATQLHSGWGAKFLDYDNDGWPDLFVAQSHVMDNIELTQPALHYEEPLLLMRNINGRFRDVSGVSGDVFRRKLAGRGAAFGDLDNDGNTDVVVNVRDGAPLILRNSGSNVNHWLTIRLTGRKSNRDALGSVVRIVADDGTQQTAYCTTSGSYLSSSDRRIHFGLGASKKVRSIEVTWPAGNRQTLPGSAADRVIEIQEDDTSLR